MLIFVRVSPVLQVVMFVSYFKPLSLLLRIPRYICQKPLKQCYKQISSTQAPVEHLLETVAFDESLAKGTEIAYDLNRAIKVLDGYFRYLLLPLDYISLLSQFCYLPINF